MPAIRWMSAHGHDTDRLLATAGLNGAAYCDPLRPIPLILVGRLLKTLAEIAGPDTPCQILEEAPLTELAMLGKVAVGSRTPLEAFGRISAALPIFCSHEQIAVRSEQGMIVVNHSYTTRLEAEAEHLMLVYAAAMVQRLCQMTGIAGASVARVTLPPHPVVGVGHLQGRIGREVVAVPNHSITLHVEGSLAHSAFPQKARDRLAAGGGKIPAPLRGDGTFSGSVRVYLIAMIEDDLPAIEVSATAANMSVRTFQRRLAEEGTSYKQLQRMVREEVALAQLANFQTPISMISAGLGYSRQSCIARSIRRWTGVSPTQLRRRFGEA